MCTLKNDKDNLIEICEYVIASYSVSRAQYSIDAIRRTDPG